jgi:hypothetical protein
MPDAPDYTINLADADATELDGNQGGKVAWHNSTTSDITLNPPACVSPGTATDIPAGTTSRNFTINGTKGDSYAYTFNVGAKLGTRNGTIKVNP